MSTKCGCGAVGLPVTADIGKQSGRACPAPTGVVNEGTAVSGKQAEGSRPLPTVEPGTAYIRKVAGGIYAAPTEWEINCC